MRSLATSGYSIVEPIGNGELLVKNNDDGKLSVIQETFIPDTTCFEIDGKLFCFPVARFNTKRNQYQ